MIGKGGLDRRICWVAMTLTALWMGGALAAQAQGPILYAQINSAPPLTANQFVDIPGLLLQLPAASPTQTSALITLNVGAPYAEGLDYPGLTFAVNVDGGLVAVGGFSYSIQAPDSFGRMPVNLVVKVPLKPTVSFVRAQWVSVRNSTGYIDSFASLSAILANN